MRDCKGLLVIFLLVVLALFLSSCDGCESAKDDGANDDAGDDDDNDTDDDIHTDDDDDDDMEGWYIYDIGPSSTEETSIAIDSNYKVHIAFLCRGEGLMYASNESGSWEIYKVSPGAYPSIAVSAGVVHISCVRHFDSDEVGLRYVRGKPGSWQEFTVADLGEDISSTTFNDDIALDSSDKIYIVYHHCGYEYPGGGCTEGGVRVATNEAGSWQVYIIDDEGMTGHHPSIAIGPGDVIHTAYYRDACEDGGGLKYATNASGNWEISIIEPYAEGYGTSIAVDASGTVHISYESRDRLKYATNKSGTWETYVISADGDDWGAYNSIAVDSKGSVHISFFNCINEHENGFCEEGVLGYATNKSGNWEILVIDSADDERVGWHTSIAVDSDDYVHISYKGANGELKYATNRPPD